MIILTEENGAKAGQKSKDESHFEGFGEIKRTVSFTKIRQVIFSENELSIFIPFIFPFLV